MRFKKTAIVAISALSLVIGGSGVSANAANTTVKMVLWPGP